MIIKIYKDLWSDSPRDWDNLGTIIGYHRSYDLSDIDFPQAGDYGSLYADFKEYLKSQSLTIEDIIYTPVYMYDHSGISLSSTPFSCRWDSGHYGYHFVTKSKVRSKYGVKNISPKLRTTILQILDNELNIYNDYINGNCYEFRIYANDTDDCCIDQCGGFIGSLDNVKLSIAEHIDPSLYDQLQAIDYNDIIY